MRRPGHCRSCELPVPRLEVRRAKIQLLASGLTVDTVDRLMPRCPDCVGDQVRRLITEGEDA